MGMVGVGWLRGGGLGEGRMGVGSAMVCEAFQVAFDLCGLGLWRQGRTGNPHHSCLVLGSSLGSVCMTPVNNCAGTGTDTSCRLSWSLKIINFPSSLASCGN
jgi:hypothetical protein